MVEARIDVAENYDRDMDGPLDFVRKCAADDPDAGDFRSDALETCKVLRERHPRDPSVFHLSGLVCFLNSNHEAAIRFWGHAWHCRPDYKLSLAAMEECLADDPYWPDVDAYMSCIRQGENVVPTQYIAQARQNFDAGEIERADYFSQRASAYNRPEVSKLQDLTQCRDDARQSLEAGTLAARYDAIVGKFEVLWAGAGEPAIEYSHALWRTVPDRVQMAEIFADIVGKSQRLLKNSPI